MLHKLKLCSTVAINYTFHFYRVREHVSISFNTHLRNYMFYSAEVGSSVKNQQCFENGKKLNAKSLKILICMVQIFPTSQQDIYDYSSSNVHKFI